MATDGAKIAKELITKVKENLESARRQEVEDRLNIYYDSWESILESEIDDQFHKETRDNIKQMYAYDVNVAKRIVKEISRVYESAATRNHITGEEKTEDGETTVIEDEAYNDLMATMPINLTMQEVNRLTNLCNECLIYIVPRNNTIEYDIITPDLVEISQKDDNAKEVEAVCFQQTFYDTEGNSTIYYVYWDIYGQHLKFDEDYKPVEIEGNEDGENPYKDPNNPGQTILPFVIFHRDFPINTIWNTTSGNDMVSSTKQVGVLLTYLNYLFKTQSFKQKYFTGIDIKDVPKDLVNDPLWSLVVQNAEGTIGVLDYQIDMPRLWDVIYSKVGAVANNYGMSLDNFKLIGSAQSGYSLRIKNLGLEKIVEEQIKQYRWYESELFEKTKLIYNYHAKSFKKKAIADNGTFSIDFAEQIYPESPDDIRKQWDFDIKMGAKSVADYARSVNPDLESEEDAIEAINNNIKINRQVERTTGINIDEILNQAFGQSDQEGGE